jgi:hypothetical protein
MDFDEGETIDEEALKTLAVILGLVGPAACVDEIAVMANEELRERLTAAFRHLRDLLKVLLPRRARREEQQHGCGVARLVSKAWSPPAGT